MTDNWPYKPKRNGDRWLIYNQYTRQNVDMPFDTLKEAKNMSDYLNNKAKDWGIKTE